MMDVTAGVQIDMWCCVYLRCMSLAVLGNIFLMHDCACVSQLNLVRSTPYSRSSIVLPTLSIILKLKQHYM